ncbi:MAG: hypothetical protein D6820_05750 [Lentisphaerae bacterium]|nr:MAG: hypothetical protein D6820_05750 [Lentisphaerota bacterium]
MNIITPCQPESPAVLHPEDFRHYIEEFNRYDEEIFVNAIPNHCAWEFLARNIPLFHSPDDTLNRIYYFRWWTFRKHLRKTSEGWVISEFGPDVDWADENNVISCAAGHHLYEARWFQDPDIAFDYANYFRKRHFLSRSHGHTYSFWAADAVYALFLVTGRRDQAIDLLDDLCHNWELWRSTHRLHHPVLFYQRDEDDGMEFGASGHGLRPTINSYMYADAVAIAKLAEHACRRSLARRFARYAQQLKLAVQNLLWNPELKFFTTRYPETDTLADVRELLGYVPWYFNLPDPGFEEAWRHLMDPCGFAAPYGPTTVEQRHPRCQILYPHGHVCRWDGPSWPYATTQTLVAMANLLNNYPQQFVQPQDYFKLLLTYARSHRKPLLEWPVPENSADPAMGIFSCDTSGPVWIEYRFPQTVSLDQTRIFWHTPPSTRTCWRFEFLHDDQWFPVETDTNYAAATRPDQYNIITFRQIDTIGFRLVSDTDVAILDWRVSGNGQEKAHLALPACSHPQHAREKLLFLNDSSVHEHHVKNSIFWDEDLYRAGFEIPWIDENLDPYRGIWLSRHLLRRYRWSPDRGGRERGKDYNHSTFADLLITGLLGIRPQEGTRLKINPLLPPDTWEYFCLDRLPYRGHTLTLLWDATGEHYHFGKGLFLLMDGKTVASAPRLTSLEVTIP